MKKTKRKAFAHLWRSKKRKNSLKTPSYTTKVRPRYDYGLFERLIELLLIRRRDNRRFKQFQSADGIINPGFESQYRKVVDVARKLNVTPYRIVSNARKNHIPLFVSQCSRAYFLDPHDLDALAAIFSKSQPHNSQPPKKPSPQDPPAPKNPQPPRNPAPQETQPPIENPAPQENPAPHRKPSPLE